LNRGREPTVTNGAAFAIINTFGLMVEEQ